MAPIGRREAMVWAAGTVAAISAPSLALGARQSGQALKTSRSRDWVLRVNVNVRKYQPRNTGRMPRTQSFKFKQGAVVFPLVDRTAGSQLDLRSIKGSVELNDKVAADTFTIIEGYHSGQKLARFDISDVDADEMELHIDLPTRSMRTQLDENLAAAAKWPGSWPADAASTFEPQMFVNYDGRGEYDMKAIQRQVKQWTGGKPKSQPPYITAKWITGQVINAFQPNGDGLNFDRSGLIEGLAVEGAAVAGRKRRGSPWDMVAFYVAVLREAGIPARIVAGYDAGGKDEEDEFLGGGNSEPELRVWAEWFLAGVNGGKGAWIPSDVVEARRTASRLPNNFMERPLPFFGTHDELDSYIPVSFHYHPPTTVRAYNSPGFWGWFSMDNPPDWAYQGLRFSARSRSHRAGEDPFADDANKQKPSRGRRRGY